MENKLTFAPKAKEELIDAIFFYNEISNIVATNFFSAIKTAEIKLLENPYGYQKIYKNFRHFVINGYPYKLIYYFDLMTNEIIIISVFHTSRNPKEWKKII